MASKERTAPRLFLDAPLLAGAAIAANADQANYLRSVLRMGAEDRLLVFNGRDGEWWARLQPEGRRGALLLVGEQVRAQEGGPDIVYLFAPLKRARLDYMVQKATELGVARLAPVLTRHTIAERVNTARMRANVIEAAEQCGILRLPVVDEPVRLEQALDQWPAGRPLLFCDEHAAVADPIDALRQIEGAPIGVLVGPEGGFAAGERDMLRATPGVVAVSLGPRIMRADTAAIAILALVNATIGDWR